MTKKKVNLVNVFISGGAAVGKSYLISTIFQTPTRTFNFYSVSPDKVEVLKMAPTGVVVVSINGKIINTVLGIPTTRANDIPKLSHKMRYKLRLIYLSIAPYSGKKNFAPFHNDLMNLIHQWEHFSYFELTQVMRQQGDSIFIDLFNNFRVGAVSEIDIALISSRLCAINNLSPPVEAIYLFVENSLKDNFNNEKLLKNNYPLIEVPSLDKPLR